MAHSKSRKQRRNRSHLSTGQLRQQTRDAIARGAYQRARECARALYKQEATPEHCGYLVAATVGRAAQLRQAGQLAEAVKLLNTISRDVLKVPDRLGPYIIEHLRAGDWQTSARLTEIVTDPHVRQQIAAQHVDAAVLYGKLDEANLPEALQPVAQRVLQALIALDQVDDAAANSAVADIPPDSPLHDWKLLVQGLTAFYAGGPKALELWQALHPDRAPAAMVAPLRVQIDPTFLSDRPERAALLALGQQVYDVPWCVALEDVQQALRQDDLITAFDHAEALKKILPADQQTVWERLALALYWQMPRLADEDDIDTYVAIFGAPADDPSLHRLRALTAEHDELFAAAQEHWAAYQNDLAKHRIIQPPEDRDLARSLVWFRMGELADRQASSPPGDFPFAFDDEDDYAFDAVKCLRQSVKLAPQHLQAHEALIDLLHTAGKPSQVVRAARRLLKQFPEHERAITTLADDAFRHGRYDEAVDLQKRAVHLRPHDKLLTDGLDVYELALSRQWAQQGKFDAARAVLNTHLARQDAPDRSHLLCRLAAVEFKAGQRQQAETLFEQACESAISRLLTVFQMLVESIRMPVDKKWIENMEREFRNGLKAKVDGASAVQMLEMLYALTHIGVSYDGMRTHRDLILQYLKRSRQTTFSEDELMRICGCLPALSPDSLLLDFAKRGRHAYPHNPVFPLAQASYHMASFSPQQCPLEEVDEALHSAQDMVEGNSQFAHMSQPIDAMLNAVHAAMRMGDFGAFGNPFDFDDEEDDEATLDPELLDALAGALGLSFDDRDEPDDVSRRKSKGGKKKRRGRR